MCGVHHDVVDGDRAAYSIDRLVEIKRDHEREIASRRTARERYLDDLHVRYAAIVDVWQTVLISTPGTVACHS
jgi:hypothetical protein